MRTKVCNASWSDCGQGECKTNETKQTETKWHETHTHTQIQLPACASHINTQRGPFLPLSYDSPFRHLPADLLIPQSMQHFTHE